MVAGSSRTRLAGLLGDRLEIAVATPPEKGKANAALARFVADLCGLRSRDVAVVSGETRHPKARRLKDIGIDPVRQALELG